MQTDHCGVHSGFDQLICQLILPAHSRSCQPLIHCSLSSTAIYLFVNKQDVWLSDGLSCGLHGFKHCWLAERQALTTFWRELQ